MSDTKAHRRQLVNVATAYADIDAACRLLADADKALSADGATTHVVVQLQLCQLRLTLERATALRESVLIFLRELTSS